MFISSLFQRLFGPPPGSLESELDNLRRNYRRTSEHLARVSQNFFENGGICCPGCGVSGYRDLEEKNERRLKRIGEIEKKLAGLAGK